MLKIPVTAKGVEHNIDLTRDGQIVVKIPVTRKRLAH
jgi:hypothetical protein